MPPLGPEFVVDPMVAAYLLTAIVLVGVSGAVAIFERFGGASRVYFQLSLLMAAWMAALGITHGTAAADVDPWLRVAYLFLPLTPPAIYRLAREMGDEPLGPPVWAVWAVGGAFAAVNAVSPWLVQGLQALMVDGTLTGGGWLGALYLAFEVPTYVLGVGLVAWSRRDAEAGEARMERLGLVAAGVLGSLPLLDYIFARDPFRAGWITLVGMLVGGIAAAVVAIRFRVFAPARSFGTDEVLRTMADAVIVSDPVGRVRSANPAAVSLLGRSERQLVGRQVGEVVGWARESGWEPLLDLGEPASEQLDLRTADGGAIRVSASIEPIRLGGRATGAVIVARDIRSQLEAHRALEAAQRRYSSLFWHNPAVLYEFDLEGRFVAVNPAGEALLGRSASELRGQPFAAVHASSDKDAVREVFRAVVAGESREYELTVRTANGGRRHVRGVSIPIFEGAAVTGVFGVALDVTEQNRIKRELEVQRRYFADLFSGSPEGIVLVDRDDTVLRINDEFTRMFGYTTTEALGRRLTELIVPEELAPEGPALNRQARTGDQVRTETVRQRKDGTQIHVSVLAREIRIPGEPRQLYGVYRDITARREAEQALKQREEELRHSQRLDAVGKLAGGIAHDFNNLLTVINGHARFALENTRDDCQARTELEEIERAGARAASLTQQLLAYSRRQVLHPKVLDPNAVIAETEGMLRRLIGEHIRIDTRYADEPVRVRADRGQLEQVLVNLVVNARDAMPGGGTITLETGVLVLGADDDRVERWSVEPGTYVRIRVADTGRGMDPDTLEHAFEPFFTTKDQGKGTGLGLATVFGIVKQSAGHVVASSEPGVGTVVQVILPWSDAELAAVETRQEVAPPATSEGGTVLVVEDEAAVRKLAVKALEKAGCTVLAAANGVDALELVDRHEGPLDLVVTDLIMPDMGGRELAGELRRKRPNLPILFMSGYDDAMVDDADPATEFLAKPFTPAALSARVASALAR